MQFEAGDGGHGDIQLILKAMKSTMTLVTRRKKFSPGNSRQMSIYISMQNRPQTENAQGRGICASSNYSPHR